MKDDTDYIQGIIDEAARTGTVQVLPLGTYHITRALKIRSWALPGAGVMGAGVRIVGSGDHAIFDCSLPEGLQPDKLKE